ncbi:hypothetical protein [Variovorax atrisoli]|uniref:hypothetical protein n=1 Tax=Variovorax atrisoli TaxID=3394203 RepID=UPI0033994292
MSAADFLFSPEVQKLLTVLYAAPADQWFPTAELARRTRLAEPEAAATVEHLVGSGIVKRQAAKGEEQPEAIRIDRSFVFHDQLRSIALRSFAAAEPIRSMLRSKFKDSVVRALVLGEDAQGTIELLIAHGQLVPDEAAMAAACQKLSKSMGRHLNVHVVPFARLNGMPARDPLAAKLSAPTVHEIIALGDTKAALPAERGGLLQAARKKLATLGRP